MFIDLFQEIEVENLFKALDLCMEYVRLDLHVFNVGAYVTCSYSNDLESLSQAEGCNIPQKISKNAGKRLIRQRC